MYIANKIREERFKLVSDAQALITQDNPSQETLETFDKMMAHAKDLKAQIDRIESADALQAEMAEIVSQTAATKHVSVAQEEDGVAQEKRIMRAILRGPRFVNSLKTADRDIAIQRLGGDPSNAAMGTTSNAGGGYTIAPLFYNELQTAMKLQGGMRAAANVITTDTGANLPFPTLDDRNNVATIIAENTQITEDTELTFGQVVLGGFTYKSGVILVSLQLLEDSAFDFDKVITDAIAGRFVRGQNAHFTHGTGSGQPRGIVLDAIVGKTGAVGQTASVTYGDLVTVARSVDPVYRPGSAWMCNDQTVGVMQKLLDGYGRPLWAAGLTGGEPDSLLGYPIVVNQDMDGMAANKVSILFGNFKTYYIRDISTSLQMLVLRERYADFLQVGYICFTRSDGRLVSAASPISSYVNSAT